MCMFEAIFFRSFHRFSLPFMDSTAHLILVINLDALASDTECCFCLFPKKYTYCDSDRTLTQLIMISRDSLKPLSHTRMSFCQTILKYNFSFWINACVKLFPSAMYGPMVSMIFPSDATTIIGFDKRSA